jgi:phosphatidylglycerol:prolipoprotein diacylglycerol transferase
MVFPRVDNVPRHPSQLYEFALEGLVLFVLVWGFSRRPRPLGAVSGLFLVGYGALRFLVEYTREPDGFLGLLALDFSMGQWLSLPMIVGGVGLLVWAYRGKAGRRTEDRMVASRPRGRDKDARSGQDRG